LAILHSPPHAVTENANTYDFFLDSRITGFEGHWMTFGGVQMMFLLLLVSSCSSPISAG